MRQRCWALVLAVVLSALLCTSSSAFEADGEADWDSGRDKFTATIPVEHSLHGDNEFTVRCKMTYSAPKHSGVSKSKRTVSVSIDPSTFSVSDLQALEALATSGKHYRIRMASDVNNADAPKIIASVPACLLIASDFHEIFRVHVDQFGHIRGLWYQTMALECPHGRLPVPSEATKVVTSVSVDMESRGPKVAVEPVAKPEGLDGEKGKVQEKTFFQKYWYYIVGFLLLVMLMGGEDPKDGGGGGGGGR